MKESIWMIKSSGEKDELSQKINLIEECQKSRYWWSY